MTGSLLQTLWAEIYRGTHPYRCVYYGAGHYSVLGNPIGAPKPENPYRIWNNYGFPKTQYFHPYLGPNSTGFVLLGWIK